MPLKFSIPEKKTQEKIASSENVVKTGTTTNKGHYCASNTVNIPITKNAQFAGSGANVTMTQPMFFSPLHTPQNFQIASKRREVYMWSRFYYTNEPKVAAGVDFYSTFSMNSFTLECSSKKILKYYEKIVKDLKLNHWLKLISHEYFMIGDVFPFVEIECPVCSGSGTKKTGEPCNHPGGTIRRMMVLNPDWIEVQSNVLASEPSITMVPDEELRQIVAKKDPIQIYRRLPKQLIDRVANGKPIPLSNRCVSHIKHNASPYGTYGESLLRRLFTVLAYKTKLMTANWIIAERLILPVRVVKIGDKDRPATAADILDVSNQLSAVANDPNMTLVTHHAFCHDEDTEVLTDNGWKKHYEVLDTDLIMIFDPVTGKSRYEKPLAFNKFDYDGPMYHFSGNKMDMKVTPNHRMLGYKRNKKDFYTEDAEIFAQRNECDRYIRNVAKYEGNEQKYVEIGEYKIPIDTFMKLAGYYLAEGCSVYNKDKRQYRVSISQSPIANPDYCSQIDDIFEALPFKFAKYEYPYKATSWDILSKSITEQFIKWFGENSYTKKIPSFIKNLSPKNLKLLIETYCNGDASKYKFEDGSVYVQCGTMSSQLADDMLEIMFKAGYSPVISRHGKTCKDKFGATHQYVVNCNLSNNSKGRYCRVKEKNIQKVDYKGTVWCFTTSTGYFVTRRDGRIAIQGNSYDWMGATGKIHNITAELEQVGKEILDGLMLNQALLNGEASCHDEETSTLTDSGFKKHYEIDENDKIACYNPETKKIEYHHYSEKHVYDYDGDMIKFKTNCLDMLVTPNHRMWVQPRDHTGFRFVNAEDVRPRAKLVGSVDGFDGDYIKSIKIGDEEYSIYDFCKLVGYFASEGCTQTEKRKNRTQKVTTVSICQSENGHARKNIEDLFENMFKTGYKNEKGVSIYKPELAKWLKENCGDHSYVKRIPRWMMNLDSSCLQLIFDALMEGDGSWSPLIDAEEGRYTYYTSSEQLALDVQELAFKCGYSVGVSTRTVEQCNKKSKKYYNKNGHEYITRKDQNVLYISTGFIAKYPTLQSKHLEYKNKEITRVPYSGKVYCFTVPYGLFVTKRNNRIAIQGNSYSSAQVGVETMIRRLESWRTTLAEWVENHIFLPIAMMQGFVKEKDADDDINEDEYLYPKLKWEDLNLRDKSGHLQLMMQLHDKQLISSQKLLQEFDIDYDQEVERLREEQVTAGPAGQMGGPGGAGGAMGGLGGGMPGMGGAPSMPAGGLDMGAGGGMPPGGPEVPGMAGGAGGAGDASGGAGMPPGGAGGLGPTASMLPSNLKIGKRGHGGKKLEDQMAKPLPPRFIKLTSLEQKLYKIIQGAEIPQQLFIQYQVKAPGEKQPFVMDFAFPSLGICLEADGSRWHEDLDSKIRDKQRDQKLANIGWRIIRFKEDALQQQPDAVKNVIIQQIAAAEQDKKKKFKKASVDNGMEKVANLLTFENIIKENLIYERIELEDGLGHMYLIGN